MRSRFPSLALVILPFSPSTSTQWVPTGGFEGGEAMAAVGTHGTDLYRARAVNPLDREPRLR
jgi:hypothetical protein